MTTGERLSAAVESATPRLQAMSDADASRSRDGKWSPKEVIGHLIDSASNNHQRFVRAQLAPDFVFPGYQQERWVEVQRYDAAPWSELVSLWRSFNLHLARVIDATPAEAATAPRANHNLGQIAFSTPPAVATLGWFMNDYVDHLEHHLAQIH